MLFDEEVEVSPNRIKLHSEETDISDYRCSTRIAEGLLAMNENFYANSLDMIQKDLYIRLNETSERFRSESIVDFFNNFRFNIDDNLKNIKSMFDEYLMVSRSIYKSNKAFVERYKDEFMASSTRDVMVTNYTIDDSVPNIEPLLEFSNYATNLMLCNSKSRKNFKMNYDMDKKKDYIAADILGRKGKKIKPENFKEASKYIYTGGSPKKVLKKLNSSFKLEIVKDILHSDEDIKEVGDNLTRFHSILMSLRLELQKEVNFLTSTRTSNVTVDANGNTVFSLMSPYDQDNYSNQLYNAINNVRVILNYYEIATASKLDAIKARQLEYSELFKNIILKRDNVMNEEDELDIEEYQFDEVMFSEAVFEAQKEISCLNMMGIMYSENEQLLEAIDVKQLFSNIAEKIKTALDNLLTRFLSTSVDNFAKKYQNPEYFHELVNKGYLDKFEWAIAEYPYDHMERTIREIKTQKMVQVDEDSVVEFRKKSFPSISSGYNGNSDKDWKTHVLNYFRGDVDSSDLNTLIDKAFAYCNKNTFDARKNALSQSAKEIKRAADDLKNKAAKAQSQTNSTTEEKKTTPNKSEGFMFDLSLNESDFSDFINRSYEPLSKWKSTYRKDFLKVYDDMQEVCEKAKSYFKGLDYPKGADKKYMIKEMDEFQGGPNDRQAGICTKSITICDWKNSGMFDKWKKQLKKELEECIPDKYKRSNDKKMYFFILENSFDDGYKAFSLVANSIIMGKPLEEDFDLLAEEEKDTAMSIDELNAKNDKANEINAKNDQADVKDKVNSQNGMSETLKIQHKYVNECIKIQGYAWSVFKEGAVKYSGMLGKIKMYTKAGQIKDKFEEMTEEKSEGAAIYLGTNITGILDNMMDTDYLKEKYSAGKALNEEAFYNTIIKIAEKNDMLTDIAETYEETIFNESSREEYYTKFTNYFSSKINPYIQKL